METDFPTRLNSEYQMQCLTLSDKHVLPQLSPELVFSIDYKPLHNEQARE